MSKRTTTFVLVAVFFLFSTEAYAKSKPFQNAKILKNLFRQIGKPLGAGFQCLKGMKKVKESRHDPIEKTDFIEVSRKFFYQTLICETKSGDREIKYMSYGKKKQYITVVRYTYAPPSKNYACNSSALSKDLGVKHQLQELPNGRLGFISKTNKFFPNGRSSTTLSVTCNDEKLTASFHDAFWMIGSKPAIDINAYLAAYAKLADTIPRHKLVDYTMELYKRDSLPPFKKLTKRIKALAHPSKTIGQAILNYATDLNYMRKYASALVDAQSSGKPETDRLIMMGGVGQ